jgi:hypothetical protein
MNTFEAKIQQLKNENSDLSNFRLVFNETALFLEGDLIEDGKNEGVFSAGVLAYFYIPTKKGYVSNEWKKTEFYKIGPVNATPELLKNLLPYIQEERQKVYIRNTGISVASALANYITKTGGDIYCNA